MEATLGQLFRPIQANGRDPSHHYVEVLPSPALRPFVSCYWLSEPRRMIHGTGTEQVQEGAIDRVLPDGCTDLLFEHDEQGQRCLSRYCGVYDHPFVIAYDLARPTKKFGVRFFPGGAYPFVQTSLSEHANQHMELDNIWPVLGNDLGERLMAEGSLAGKVRIMESFLLKRLAVRGERGVRKDIRMSNLLHRIFASEGVVGIRELADAEGISPRQMQRKFDQWIGFGPKRFSEIVRFQSVVKRIKLAETAALDWRHVAVDYGYFDQAHFIHDFKRFYGELPLLAAKEFHKASVFYNPLSK